MSFFPVQKVRNRQPQPLPVVKAEFRKHLAFLWIPGLPELVTKKNAIISSGGSIRGGRTGRVLKSTLANYTGTGAHFLNQKATTSNVTMLVSFDKFSGVDNGGSPPLFGNSTNRGVLIDYNGQLRFMSSVYHNTGLTVDGNPHTVCTVFGESYGSEFFLDASGYAYQPGSGLYGWSASNYRCVSGGDSGGSIVAETSLVVAWNVRFPAALARSLAKNPWQIFEPEKRLLFNFSGSSGAYTLTASGGTYTVQGASAGIFRSRILSGTGGSYTLTGGQAVVSRNRKLVASGGIYNYTGQFITITHTGTSNAYTLTAQGGSYALNGGSALILKSKRITSVGGVYTLTGSDAVVLKSKYLTAASGTYSLTGGTATVLKSKVLISTGGVYSYTGSSTVIKKSKYLSALGGSYSLVGSSVVLVHGGIGGIVWPPVHLVVLGTAYGPTGSEYMGTLDVNGIKYDITTGQLVKPISDKVVMSL